MPTVQDKLYEVALDRGLRQSTLLSYRRLLGRCGLLSMETDDVTPQVVTDAIWTIDNVNTRRAAVIACRSVFGFSIKIPKGLPRRYDLPDEDTLRLALMTSPHEIRGLLMMYAGLRVGEACAITASDVAGDRLSVTKQIVQLHDTGKPTTNRVGPVKTSEDSVIIPFWLSELVLTVNDTTKPDIVRESLRRAGQKVGIKLTPHMLRHYYATTLLRSGLSFELVRRQLRHSDIAVTLRTYDQFNIQDDIHRLFDK